MPAIEAAINHLSNERAGIKGVYNRGTQERQKRELMEKWGAHIEQLTAERPEHSWNLARFSSPQIRLPLRASALRHSGSCSK